LKVKNNKNSVRTIFVIIFERKIPVFINYISLNGFSIKIAAGCNGADRPL